FEICPPGVKSSLREALELLASASEPEVGEDHPWRHKSMQEFLDEADVHESMNQYTKQKHLLIEGILGSAKPTDQVITGLQWH
ncbi:hypothetical protein HY218_01030, partial [Candidatus Saccharibacteria bacterium]|nr:hypothetical protein [Candidatus Saccharibacteria bacterium]